MQYKLIKPCTVPQKDGTAVSYRRVDEEIDVPNQDDADRLVRNGFLAPIEEPVAEVEFNGETHVGILPASAGQPPTDPPTDPPADPLTPPAETGDKPPTEPGDKPKPGDKPGSPTGKPKGASGV